MNSMNTTPDQRPVTNIPFAAAAGHGDAAPPEIYFKTDRDNYAAIAYPNDPSRVVLLSQSAVLAARREGRAPAGTVLTNEDVATGLVATGGQLFFGHDRTPAGRVGSIAVVAAGANAPARNEFWDLPSRSARESQRPPGRTREKVRERDPQAVTQDDAGLVRKLLYSKEDIYSMLTDRDKRIPNWPGDTQAWAQKGICELIAAEYEPNIFSSYGQGIRAMRQTLRRLQTERPEAYARNASAGRKLAYQFTTNPDHFGNKVDDYLHFGVRFKPAPGAPRLPATTRVYVTTKLWSAGQVAANVIRTARTPTYSPYGKVYDQSTKDKDISLRKDRLLFACETQEELDAILGALRLTWERDPGLFEDALLPLVEATDIPGVGLAEEPVQDEDGFKESFNERGSSYVMDAWDAALDGIPGTKLPKGAWAGVGARHKRAELTRDLVRSGSVSMDQLVAQFRRAMRQTAPTFGVSPHNVARNRR